MITIKNYKQVKYSEIIDLLKEAKNMSGKNDFEIALELKIKSQTTIRNLTCEYAQKVSDEKLSSFMSLLGLSAAIVYVNGERMYFVKQ